MAPAERLSAEAGLLGPLPRARFDTARREPRVVSAPLPLIEVDRVAYSVPPNLVGGTVEVRLPVDAGIVEIAHHGEVIVTHRLGTPGGAAVWDPTHRAAAEAIALAPHRRHLSVVAPVVAPVVGREVLDLGNGDYDIAPVDLAQRYDGCGCMGSGV